MRWKKQKSNLIVVSLLSIAYTIVTIMMLIAPMHMNSMGNINQVSGHALYAIMFWVLALVLSWYLYAVLRSKPELLFFVLMILGIVLIIAEIFMFG